ncbi:helix-turn-helix domain-containing protein [Epilithonimonas hungarica]|uniref:Uncharacterized conserved protein, Tic20 family n=1 Tax=Epilithonimonas hungarica TaxID=454006 RepID=A0A1G7ISE3_9FLAO|nr:helix-turn-helix domain-containing protein [Epilithonimonas hungarica]SDF15591.1 Uncharacterized conserved protein, Tic20 family [Epilithonimonas hungarica]
MTISKLATYRRNKGLSQEQLSELSGVSVRTIQRIEKGTVEAHLTTLKLLAECLDVKTEDLLKPEEASLTLEEIKKPGKIVPLYQILALAGLFFPILNIILPAVLWWMKKDELPEYDSTGKETINFQISITMLFIPAIVLMVYEFPIGFSLVLLIYIYALVLTCINLIRAVNKQSIRYPLSFSFLR